MPDEMHNDAPVAPPLRVELAACWQSLPNRPWFVGLLAVWIGLFQFLGNSTFGYINTPSIFAWLYNAYASPVSEDGHGLLVPVVVFGLLWWKRGELKLLPKGVWPPALWLVAVAVVLHVLGYVVQQPRVSAAGFFLGLYGLTGLTWGKPWLAATLFPFLLFGFCIPVGAFAEPLSFPLRLVATKITVTLNNLVLGLNVIQDGTRVFNEHQTYQYEVAAACSGLHSLTAMFMFSSIYAFVMFRGWCRRGLLILACIPVAVLANVVRLTMIILAAEAFNQEAGNYVHNSSWLGLLPYVPAFVALLGLGHVIREETPSDAVKEGGS
jgi:exosortase